MKHPSESTLALYAGQDLGPFARWRTGRHLAGCAECRGEVTAYSALRQETAELNQMPEIPWNRLAAEMKGNIRVGLAAGECIRETASEPLFTGARMAAACASAALLLLAGFWLERPAVKPVAEAPATISLAATAKGIEVREGDQAFVLKNGGPTEDVVYSAGERSIGARFVDPGTGYVTINKMYVQ